MNREEDDQEEVGSSEDEELDLPVGTWNLIVRPRRDAYLNWTIIYEGCCKVSKKCCIGIIAVILLVLAGFGSYYVVEAIKEALAWKYEESGELWFGYWNGDDCFAYCYNYTYPTPQQAETFEKNSGCDWEITRINVIGEYQINDFIGFQLVFCNNVTVPEDYNDLCDS